MTPGYQAVRTALLERLRSEPELAALRVDESEDWIVGLCDAWAALAEVFGFYQERILEEAFLATAQQPSSVELIYHSLGHRFPPNATATTTLAYHLSPKVAGVEAVGRARGRGGTGTSADERARLAGGSPSGAGVMAGPAAAGYGGPGAAAGNHAGAGDGGGPAQGGRAGAGAPLPGAGINAPPGVAPPPASAPGIAMPGGTLAGDTPGAPAAGGAPGAPGGAPGAGGYGGNGLPGSGGAAIPTGARPTGGRPFVGAPAGIATGPAAVPDAAPAIGVASQIPPAAQVRAIPSASGAAPVFVTLAPLGAYVGASRLGVSTPKTQLPPQLTATTSQLELAGAKTGLAAGQPVLVTATDAAGAAASWVRVVTAVKPDAVRGSTRITWDTPLGAKGEPAPAGTTDPVVYGFSSSSALVGATAPDWSSCTLAQQLATTTNDGEPLPVRGGLATSDNDGASWTPQPAATPAGADLAAVACFPGVTILAAGSAWLLRSVAGAPFSAVSPGGGARRPVGFLGGTRGRMLAGAAGGTVYESIDQGQTWSVVSGSAPTLLKAEADTRSVVTNQIPAATVRSVIDGSAAGFDLLAGTDAGLYAYTKQGAWLAVLADGKTDPIAAVQTPRLAFAVFALAPTSGGYAAATAKGIYEYDQSGWSRPVTTPAYALTTADTAIYAATADGIAIRDSAGAWFETTSTGLPATRITALIVAGEKLLAATAQGVYATPLGAAPQLTWKRCDHAPAFALPYALFAPPTASDIPDGLYAGFAGYGIALGSDAATKPARHGFELTDGGHAYAVVPVTTTTATTTTKTWKVALLDALPSVNDLALAPGGTVIAAADAATPAATDWPGFAVAGTEVEIAPPVRGVAAGVPALIEQRTPTPAAQVLDVTAVAQDAGVRAGRRTTLTRLTFETPLPPRAFPRSVSTVWTGATAKPLFVPPATAVPQVAGKGLTLASQLPAPVAPGRLATVSGAPPGLAVAPLGGTFRIAAPKAAPTAEGPSQADVADLATLPDGTVLAATAEGVFSLADGVQAQLLDGGWPGGPSAALAIAGSTALAASAHGVQRLTEATQRAPASWTAALRGRAITALGSDGTAVVACEANGALHVARDAAGEPEHWDPLAALPHAATALAISSAGMWAATAAGVLTYDEADGWRPLGGGAPAGTVTCLQIDAGGRLWAGGTAGLQSVDPTTGAWALDPDVPGPVPALCVTPTLALLAYGANGVLRRVGSTWQPLTPAVGAAVTALAGAPDGSLWIGSGAALPLPTLPGAGAQQVSHTPFIPAVGVDAADVATLTQGAVPDRLLSAFADAGTPLDTTRAAVSARGSDCWLIRVAAQLYVVALRSTGSAALTLTVHRNQAVLHPTAAPATANGVQTWPIEVGGVAATLSAPKDRIVALPADADSPALAESATLAAPPGGDGAAVTTVGAGTQLTFAQPLTHVYDASTVQVDLNVVSAAQGQPVSVPIGSGDPKVANQRFPIPTPVVAIGPTAASPASTTPATSLRVYVDGQPWAEVASLHAAGPEATVYMAQHNADGTATVCFGDGSHGARLPAGHDNVVATYLQGGGAGGEVARGTLIQPLARPQLVKAVQNPLAALVPATAPLVQSRMAGVRALDRIVTHGDYEDLAAAQPGVASAAAELIAAAFGRALVITVAGAASAAADLPARVQQQVGLTTPSGVPVRVVAARLVGVRIELEVVSTRHAVEAAVRARLGGLAAHRPGGALLASQLLAAVTGVPGVEAANITRWDRVGRPAGTTTQLSAERAAWPAGTAAPRAAELLVVDVDRLQVTTVAPRAVART